MRVCYSIEGARSQSTGIFLIGDFRNSSFPLLFNRRGVGGKFFANFLDYPSQIKNFTAIDWDSLDAGGFSTTIPLSFNADSTISETVIYPQYLWLLEKDQEKGGTGKINSRNVAVFVLGEVVADTTNTGHFNLKFRRLS